MDAPALDFVAALAIALASALAGWVAARRVATHRALLAALGFALVAWPVLCAAMPDRFHFLYPASDHGELAFASAFFLPGVLAGAYADTALRRILQGVMTAVVAYFVLAEPLWFAFEGATLRQLNGATRDGVVIQTEPYTCVPAAVATVLRRWGVEATEGEVAYRLRTAFQGTHPARIPRTVRVLGQEHGLRARILSTTLDELARLDRPAILLGWSGSIRHAVALLELDDTHIAIGDPLSGAARLPRQEFERHFRWSGLAVLIETFSSAAQAPRLGVD